MIISKKTDRTYLLELSNKTVETPCFVPSISSIKSNQQILDYLHLIEKSGYNSFLVSAYDLYHLNQKTRKEVETTLKELDKKQFLFYIDNGNYEAYWKNDHDWNFEKFEGILKNIDPTFCFSFDVFWTEQAELERLIDNTITSIAKTAGSQKTGTTIGLIHSHPNLFPKMVRKIVNSINPEIIAVPERELGVSILERASSIKKIRDELEKKDSVIPLHVLGVGNPVSILIYTLCGADMFDSLDWYNSVIDPSSGQFLHFSHKELIECDCEVCKMEKIPYEYQVITHNLVFYVDFLEKIRIAISENEVDEIMKKYLNKKIIQKVKRITG